MDESTTIGDKTMCRPDDARVHGVITVELLSSTRGHGIFGEQSKGDGEFYCCVCSLIREGEGDGFPLGSPRSRLQVGNSLALAL